MSEAVGSRTEFQTLSLRIGRHLAALRSAADAFWQLGADLERMISTKLYRVEGHKDFGSYCRSLDPPISPRWAYQVVENYRAGGRMRDQSRIHLLGYSEIAELVQAPEEDRAAILEEATANGDIPTAARLRQLIDKGQAGQPPAEQLRALSTEDKLQQVEAEEREQLRQERQATSTDLLRQIDRLAARCRRLHTRLDQVEDADLLLAAYRQVIAGVGEGNELALAELRRAAAAFLERVEGRAAA